MNEYTSRVEQILSGTFVGEPLSRVEALLIAWVQSGGGGGGTPIQTSAGKLTAPLTITKAVGGLTVGKTYPIGTPIEQVLKDAFGAVSYPTLTAPSATLSGSGEKLLEKGTTANVTLTATFNRGSISPAYGTNGFRSGTANTYSLNGGPTQTQNSFAQVVSETNNTFFVDVAHAAGEQPKDSDGNNYQSALQAGTVRTNTVSYEFVEAIWSNTGDGSSMAKEPLVSKSVKSKIFKFKPQTVANPSVFDMPASWNIVKVEMYNSITKDWSLISHFDITDVTHDSIAYKRYTDNLGYAVGAREIKVTWS